MMRWIIAGPILVVLSLGVASGPGISSATVPGENGRILFSKELDIFAMNPDGTDVRRLTDSPAWDGMPVSSPDGTRIAFTSERDGHSEIYVMNSDGSGQTRVTTTPQPGESRMPAWSPDDQLIAFERSNYQVSDIYAVETDGTGLRNLTSFPVLGHAAYYPQWSPDGSRLVFHKVDPGEGSFPDICVMNADGTGQANLTTSVDHETHPVWSPDGTTILYANKTLFGELGELWTMTADGTNHRLLSDRLTHRAVWSPDGKLIAVEGSLTPESPDSGIYIIRSDGTEPVPIQQVPEQVGDWQVRPGTMREAPPLPPLARSAGICNSTGLDDVPPPTPPPPPSQPLSTGTPGALPITGVKEHSGDGLMPPPLIAGAAGVLLAVAVCCFGLAGRFRRSDP